MARIFIDLERTKNPYCGLGQYGIALGQALQNIHHEQRELVFFIPRQAQRYFSPTGSYNLSHPLKKQLIPPQSWLLPSNIDLWHITNQDSEYFPFHKGGLKLLTIHDLNFLYSERPEKIRRRLRRLVKRIQCSHHISTISNFVKSEIMRVFRLPDEKISVIYNGVARLDRVLQVPPQSGPEDFLFTIGQVVEKKNFHTLVEMMPHLTNHNLVIAGQKDSAYAARIQQRIKELDLEQRVTLCGTVSEGEKSWLLSHCDAFLFPSLSEGFGIPPVEAMSMGKPVFLSRLTSLPEIGGDHAYYWDSFEPATMATTVTNGIADFKRDQLGEASIAYAARFNWDRSARDYIELYDRLLSSRIDQALTPRIEPSIG